MAQTYRILGQISPTASSTSAVYTVPSGSSAVLSTIAVTNRSASAGTYSIFLGQAGASPAASNQFAASVAVAANDTVALTLGVTLAATDVVNVQPSASTITFHAFGAEIS